MSWTRLWTGLTGRRSRSGTSASHEENHDPHEQNSRAGRSEGEPARGILTSGAASAGVKAGARQSKDQSEQYFEAAHEG